MIRLILVTAVVRTVTSCHSRLNMAGVKSVSLWDMLPPGHAAAVLMEDLNAELGDVNIVFFNRLHKKVVDDMHLRHGCQALAQEDHVAYWVSLPELAGCLALRSQEGAFHQQAVGAPLDMSFEIKPMRLAISIIERYINSMILFSRAVILAAVHRYIRCLLNAGRQLQRCRIS